MSDNISGKKQSDILAKASSGDNEQRSLKKGVPSSDMSVYKGSAEESVRYKGTREKSLYKGSEEYFEYSCDPCSRENEHTEASGFCTNCDEYLCAVCFKAHKKNKVTGSHALLDKTSMPKKNITCDPCKRAGDNDEEAVGYCNDCGEYLCNSCFRSHSISKASSQHELLPKDKMPKLNAPLTSSLGRTNISGQDAISKRYDEEYTYIRDFNVKATDDEKCYITDMTIVNNTELILADNQNKSLKLVDLTTCVLKHSLTLEACPNGLAAISNDQVAVVLQNKCKILIILVSGGLTVVRTVKTNGNCVDIKCVNEKLYVSFKDPVKFQILKKSGAKYKTINPDSEILKHCTLPRHITVSPDESTLYISDWRTNHVMSMDMDGNMISVYQGELDHPHDITISPFGSVYLCNWRQHVIYKMTSDLSEATVILGKDDGLMYPKAMCFNASQKQLYTSNGSTEAKYRNFIKLFEWK